MNSRMMVLACALALAATSGRPARAHDIVAGWAGVKMPPAPQPKDMHLDPAQAALLVLDFDTGNCTMAKRPSCFQSLPKVAALLAAARAHGMLVVYSTAPTASLASVPAALAPAGTEPVVHAGVDKFLGTDLLQVLQQHHVRQVVVTGTSAHGAVLYTASAAALRGFSVAVPVDGMSAEDPFAELATAWILGNAPASVASHMTLTRSDLIHID